MGVHLALSSIASSIEIGSACIKGFSTILKNLKDVDNQLSSLEFKKELVELQNNLVTAKGAIIDLLQENQELRYQLQLKDEMQLDNDSKVYWRIKNGIKEGPFCSICYGDSAKLIPLHPRGSGSCYCSKCKGHFQTQQAREEQIRSYQNLGSRFH